MISLPPPQPDLSSSSSSSSSSTESSSSAHPLPRKIRFAPLPRPPSLESLDDRSSSSSTPIPRTPSPPPLPLPPPPLLPQQYQQIPRRSSKFSWLKRFLRRLSLGSFSAPPSPRIPYLEHSSRPASINNSETSFKSTTSFSIRSLSLRRWFSSTSLPRLSSVASLSSTLSGPHPPPPGYNRSTTKIPRRSASLRESSTDTKSKGGTRMLNGRVYRGRRARRTQADPNANPFANARDEADPVFVEWGYGGMGAVHSAAGAGVWKRVQSSQVALGDSDNASLDAVDALGMEESSGMGWVRKRREMREKQQREAQGKSDDGAEAATTATQSKDSEKEKQESDAFTIPQAHPPSDDSTPTPQAQLVPGTDRDTNEEHHKLQTGPVPALAHGHRPHSRSGSMTNTAAGSETRQHTSKAPKEHHNLQAVAVPASAHSHRLRMRSNSTQTSPTTGPATTSVDPAVPVTKSCGVLDLMEFRQIAKGRKGSKVDEDESSSESENDDKDEDDDDEDDALTEAGRRALLALSAGVEKISRHQDKKA